MAQTQTPTTTLGEGSLDEQPRSGFEDAFIAFGRAAWIGTVCGVGVGFVLGIVNRLVMRVVAIMNGPTPIETDFGAQVLNFTVGGTVFLITSTMLIALVPGLIYMGVRRLLPGGVAVGGLVFGVLIAAVAGTAIVDAQARDFRLLGEPMVSAAMFLGMFILFGLLLAPLVARLDRRVSHDPSDRVSALYAAAGSLIVLLAAQGLFAGRWTWLLLVPLGFAFAVSAGERRGAPWSGHRRSVRVGGYLALAVPLVPGLIDLGQELSLIALA